MRSNKKTDSGARLKMSTLKKDSSRNPFSAYLPYTAYDAETKTYVLQDSTIGALWECSPLAFASEQTANCLEGIFRLGLPENAVLQFILYADPHITPFLENYKNLKTRKVPLVEEAVKGFTEFLATGSEGVKKLSGIPLRNFRLFMALKVPTAKINALRWEYLRASVEEAFRGASLWPKNMAPEDLLEWSRRVFNIGTGDPGSNPKHWDEEKEIRDQIIYSETQIKDEGLHLEIGDNHWACLTPKANPKEVDLFTTNRLAGGVWGLMSDSDQIQTPFLISVNLVFENLVPKLHAKCNVILGQGAAGSFAPSLMRKKEEYLRAVDSLERGAVFVRVMQSMWVWGKDEKHVAEALTRARRIWENCGYVMQRDRGILKVLFISSLPFGLYPTGKNMENIARDSIADCEAATAVLPVQADFAGGGKPVLVFAGRKGQLATLDFFCEEANNHNFVIAAESGSGKSFLLNYICFNYWANNALVRIVDIGGSYKKLAKITGGRYIDFGDGAPLCLNPFTNIVEPEHELQVVDAVVSQMIFSKSDATPSETESSLIQAAVRWAWEKEGNDADIDVVHAFLSDIKQAKGSSDNALKDSMGESLGNSMFGHPKVIEQAGMLSLNLREFTSDGSFGKFFNGRSTFDIRSDEFVVLELEHLKGQKALFRVVTLLVINAVTQDLYLSDRTRERFLLFEEAWQFLQSKGDTLTQVITEGYRRARKYSGSFGVIVQSIEDLASFGSVGQVILNNSAFKLFLQSKGFKRAKDQGLVDYDDFTMKILSTVASKRGAYSEIFADTPFGAGILRLIVDDFFYGVCTSSGKESGFIEQCVANGMDYVEAIKELAARRKFGGGA